MNTPNTLPHTTAELRPRALFSFVPAMLSLFALLAISMPAIGQAAGANQLVIDMKATIGDRHDGKLAFSDANGKKIKIDVYFYRNTVSNKTQIVLVLKDPAAGAGEATFAKLFPDMNPSLQCMTYMGEGADLASAVKALEKRIQGLAGDKITVAVTKNAEARTAKLTITQKKNLPAAP